MKVTFWGTRGSLAAPGPDTARYGGNTSCIQVTGETGRSLIFDAGTGLRRLGGVLAAEQGRVDIFLTHLHMDHIQGLGFFAPLYIPDREVHVWGPSSSTQDLRSRLVRYLSPPLFPVSLRELPCKLTLHEVPLKPVEVSGLTVQAVYLCHPGPTVGYRISDGRKSVAYMPDHEPALGRASLSLPTDWLSGFDCAKDSDLLIHDAQYTDEEYDKRTGWGHSSLKQAVTFSQRTDAKRLVLFHHDPAHDDIFLETQLRQLKESLSGGLEVSLAMEGETVEC